METQVLQLLERRTLNGSLEPAFSPMSSSKSLMTFCRCRKMTARSNPTARKASAFSGVTGFSGSARRSSQRFAKRSSASSSAATNRPSAAVL